MCTIADDLPGSSLNGRWGYIQASCVYPKSGGKVYHITTLQNGKETIERCSTLRLTSPHPGTNALLSLPFGKAIPDSSTASRSVGWDVPLFHGVTFDFLHSAMR